MARKRSLFAEPSLADDVLAALERSDREDGTVSEAGSDAGDVLAALDMSDEGSASDAGVLLDSKGFVVDSGDEGEDFLANLDSFLVKRDVTPRATLIAVAPRPEEERVVAPTRARRRKVKEASKSKLAEEAAARLFYVKGANSMADEQRMRAAAKELAQEKVQKAVGKLRLLTMLGAFSSSPGSGKTPRSPSSTRSSPTHQTAAASEASEQQKGEDAGLLGVIRAKGVLDDWRMRSHATISTAGVQGLVAGAASAASAGEEQQPQDEEEQQQQEEEEQEAEEEEEEQEAEEPQVDDDFDVEAYVRTLPSELTEEEQTDAQPLRRALTLAPASAGRSGRVNHLLERKSRITAQLVEMLRIGAKWGVVDVEFRLRAVNEELIRCMGLSDVPATAGSRASRQAALEQTQRLRSPVRYEEPPRRRAERLERKLQEQLEEGRRTSRTEGALAAAYANGLPSVQRLLSAFQTDVLEPREKERVARRSRPPPRRKKARRRQGKVVPTATR